MVIQVPDVELNAGESSEWRRAFKTGIRNVAERSVDGRRKDYGVSGIAAHSGDIMEEVKATMEAE